MRYLLLVVAFIASCSKAVPEVAKTPEKILPVFDFQGLHLGDPAPERLKSQFKGEHREFVEEKIADTDFFVYYIVIEGRIEGLTIEYANAQDAIEIYTKKLGSKPVSFDGKAAWETKDGLFVIDLATKQGEIASKIAVKDGNSIHQKKLDELGSKL